jgi:CheY-like chemotaxis protein
MSKSDTATRRPFVLLVDPDGDTRALYRTALAAAGYDVDEAEDGREALAKVFDRRPAFVVTETRLSFINGYELCMLLRHDDQTSDVRLIVLSGDSHPEHISRAWDAKADSVLVKPCLPETLAEEIRRLLEKPLARRNLGKIAKAKAVRKSAAYRSKTRTHERFETTRPPIAPPSLYCPSCDAALLYERSRVGGVNDRNPEQWDYFLCAVCGDFEYRQRTRKLRRVE